MVPVGMGSSTGTVDNIGAGGGKNSGERGGRGGGGRGGGER